MNANCFKTVFSERSGCLVAVGEHAFSQGKSSGESAFGRSAFGASVLASAGVFIGALVLSQVFVGLAWAQPAANALPTGGTVVQGAASLAQSANQLHITQSSQRAAINWQSFDIGASAKVNVVQPNAQAVLLNRVVGQSPSQIFGQLQANGHVILVNPNGVLFGKDGSVNAGSFTASTLGITDANFMAGNMVYERNGSTAGVVNQGTIEVSPGGYVALLGASVSNEGKIIAPKGGVALGAAETIKVPVTGSGRIKLELTAGDINASVKNSGAIVSEGGQVYMQALALNRAAAQILQSGRIDTTGEQGGAVHLLADGGTIKVDGSITANSTGKDDKGQALAGGDIYIGRDKDTNVLAAVGDVSGAMLESRGGFVETSGQYLVTTGARVLAKDWLLDPYNITITGTASGTAYTDPNSGGSYDYAPSATSSVLASDIQNSLNNGTNVKISTGLTGSLGSDAGNITVASNITKSSGGAATLTLEAHNTISINSGVNITDSGMTTRNLGVQLTANGASNNGSSVVIGSNAAIDVGGAVNIDVRGGTSGATNAGLLVNSGSQTHTNPTGTLTTIRGGSVHIDSTVSGTNVTGIFAKHGILIESTSGDVSIQTTHTGASTTGSGLTIGSDWSSLGPTGGNPTSPLLKSSGSLTLLTTTAGTNANGSMTFSDTRFQASGDIALKAQTQQSSTTAINFAKTFGTNPAHIRSTSGDVLIQSNQGAINMSGLVAANAIQGRNITLDNTGGSVSTANVNGLVALTKGGGTSTSTSFSGIQLTGTTSNAIVATANLNMAGDSQSTDSNAGINLGVGISGKNVNLNGSSINGNGIYSAQGVTAGTGGDVNILGISTGAGASSTALSLWGAIGAGRNILIHGKNTAVGNANVATFLNNSVTSGAGVIEVLAEHAGTGLGLQLAAASALNTTNNAITLTTDSLFNNATGVNAGTGTVTVQNKTAGVLVDLGATSDTLGVLSVSATELGKITAGKTIIGSTSAGHLTVSQAITSPNTVGDLVLMTGGNLAINAALQAGATATKNLTLHGAGTTSAVTQSAAIKASGLELLGSNASFVLNSVANDVATLAGNGKSVSYTDANALTIGTVNSTSGITAAGTVSASTLSGHLSVTQEIRTSDTSIAAIGLVAGESTAAGTASGGDISFSGSGAVSVGTGGRATLYTGSLAGSTGLGIVAGNNRYNSDELASNYTSALGTGVYAIYREAPSLSINVSNASKTYDGAAFSGGNGFTESGATGLKNGDTLSSALSSAAWGGNAQNAVNAGTYTLSASESVAGKSALGYVTTYTSGTLSVNKKDVSLVSITAANKTYDGSDAATVTAGSISTGVGTETLLISGSGTFSDKNAADGKTVTVADVTALTKTNGTGDWNNYNLTTTGAMITTANIAKKDVSLASITAANKAYDGSDAATITAGNISTGVGSETLLISGSGTFSNKNAADGKTVTVADVTALTKTNGTGDWDNYNLTTTGAMTTTANIAKKDVSLTSITAANKVYDGSDAATITAGSINTGVGTETLLISGSGTFSDKNADINKTVTVADVTALTKTNGTGDWNNYNLITTGAKTTTATIDKATLSAALTGTVEKVYDGTTAASNLVNANFAVTGWVAGEGATVSQTAASYSSKNVSDNSGTGAVSAVLSSLHFTAAADTLLSNYELPTTASGNVGKITPAPLVVKVNDSAAFVTMNASQATDNGLRYTGLVNGENAASALTGIGTRTYLPASLTPVAGTYTDAFGLSSTPNAVNGNYDVTVQKGTLTVVPADKLLITIAGKTETYGVLTAANAGLSASTVTAQYCLTSTCVSSLVDLTVSRLPDGRWQATDATGTSVTFSTLVDTTGKISTGGFVNAGNYTYDASNTLPPSGANFNGRVVNGGVLTIDPKAVTLEASGVTKTYDGSMALAGRSVDITNAMSGDQVSASSSGGSFLGKNAGTQGYTLTGLSLSGADSANYSIATQLSGSDGRIDTRSVILTAGSVVKTYDGSTSYAVTQADLDALSLQLVPGDRVTAAQLAFADKNVSRAGNGTVLSDKTVTLNSVTLNDGNSGGNYSLTLQGNQTSTISPKTLQAAGAVADKVYDGTRLATLGDLSGSGVVAGDVVSFQASSALFDNKSVLRDGGGQVLDRMVTVSGLTLGGPQAGNYDLSSGSFTTQAKILPLELIVEASAQNKTYDGTRAATGTLEMTGFLTGESVSLNWGAGQFASKDVARDGTGQVTAQTVTFAGLQLAGPDADNYSLASTTATTTARIMPKLLSVSGTRVANKTQDGTTQAEASAGSLSGLVGAEMLQAVAMASFDSASAGSNKNVTVRYSLANGSNGGLAGNYELMDEVLTASILAQAGGNPVQPLVIPAESTVQSYLRSSGSSATAVTTSKPELESRNECSSLTPEDCDCQPSTLSGVDICMVPLKVVRDRPGLPLGATFLRD